MTLFYVIVGIVFISAAIGIGLFWSIGYALESWRQARYAVHCRQKEIACRELAHDVETISWWFTESDHATKALQELAKYMSENGCIRANEIREKWRKVIKPDGWKSGFEEKVQ